MRKRTRMRRTKGGVFVKKIFDPFYVAEVLNDILGRRGLKVELVPMDKPETPPEEAEASA